MRDGEVIGEGFHAELGELHAERAALADCRERGNDPAGATMYVTLEPCAHTGRQPPCTEAILEAGISRVVIASEDPSGKAAGRGPGILRDGGVEVEFAAGEEATAARLLNQPFRKHARTGLPLVTLKLAMSLDGRTSTAPGDSPWISGEQSRELVHRWRAESDAMAVGIGTVLADDPLHRSPRPHSTKLVSRSASSSIARLAYPSTPGCSEPSTSHRCSSSSRPKPTPRLFARQAQRLLVSDGIEPALAELGRRGITSLFLEGGPTLASAFQSADQLDEARTFVAPVLLGGPRRFLARVARMRGGRERRRSPRPQAPPQSRQAPRA